MEFHDAINVFWKKPLGDEDSGAVEDPYGSSTDQHSEQCKQSEGLDEGVGRSRRGKDYDAYRQCFLATDLVGHESDGEGAKQHSQHDARVNQAIESGSSAQQVKSVGC